MSTVTPEKARELWVEALRSGEYRQGKNYLHEKRNDGDTFCCLGVACDIAAKNGVEIEVDEQYAVVRYDSYTAALPSTVVNWLGINSRFGGFGDGDDYMSLTTLNDQGTKFAEIADTIENKPPGLFRD